MVQGLVSGAHLPMFARRLQSMAVHKDKSVGQAILGPLEMLHVPPQGVPLVMGVHRLIAIAKTVWPTRLC